MHCVIGVGDGQVVQELASCGDRVVALPIGNEPCVDGVECYPIRSAQDVAAVAHLLYGGHVAAVDLVDTQFHCVHEVADQQTRTLVVQELFGLLGQMPYLWGNSTLDGMCGLVNLAHNAKTLLPAPELETITHSPAIAVGAGPSLANYLDALRELQDGYLIVACDAALGPLNRAGVRVDAVTPLERLNSTAEKMRGGEAVCYAGTPVVPPNAVTGCQRALYIPQPDNLYDWLEDECHRPFVGSTSGSMAAAVAMQLTAGPVYLVGLDLCASGEHHHVPGAASAKHYDEHQMVTVRHNNGGTVRTRVDWARSATEIASMIVGHPQPVYHVGALDGIGVRIQGSIGADLEDYAHQKVLHWPEPEQNYRLQLWRDRARCIYFDWRRLVAEVERLCFIEHFQLDELANGANADAFAYVLRPLFAQLSVERRLGRPESALLKLAKQRVANIDAECSELFKEVAHVAEG